nr:MAG TPA: hypothetical protein [Caudoviricetes sp.]
MLIAGRHTISGGKGTCAEQWRRPHLPLDV